MDQPIMKRLEPYNFEPEVMEFIAQELTPEAAILRACHEGLGGVSMEIAPEAWETYEAELVKADAAFDEKHKPLVEAYSSIRDPLYDKYDRGEINSIQLREALRKRAEKYSKDCDKLSQEYYASRNAARLVLLQALLKAIGA